MKEAIAEEEKRVGCGPGRGHFSPTSRANEPREKERVSPSDRRKVLSVGEQTLQPYSKVSRESFHLTFPRVVQIDCGNCGLGALRLVWAMEMAFWGRLKGDDEKKVKWKKEKKKVHVHQRRAQRAKRNKFYAQLNAILCLCLCFVPWVNKKVKEPKATSSFSIRPDFFLAYKREPTNSRFRSERRKKNR